MENEEKLLIIVLCLILFIILEILFVSAKSIDFNNQQIKTGEYIIQSQDGIDAYYDVNFTHLNDSDLSDNIQIDYCLTQDKLDEAQSPIVEQNGTVLDSPYVDYQPDNIRIRKDIAIGKNILTTDEIVDTQQIDVMVHKLVNIKHGNMMVPTEELVDEPTNCISITANPYITDKIELGQNSTLIISQTDYVNNLRLNNVSTEANFTHLTIDNTQSPYDSLVAYYSFDVNNDSSAKTYDYSSRNNDGNINGARFTNNGFIGGAYQFNGSSIITAGMSGITTNSSFTLTSWVNFSNATIGYNKRILISSTDTLGINVDSTSKLYSCYVKDFFSNPSPWKSLTAGNVNYNAWDFVACSYNGTNLTLYVNGIQVGSNTNANGLLSGGSVFIGNWNNMAQGWNGSIDEVMIFNTSLNSSQISDIYNNQSLRFKTNAQEINIFNISNGNNQLNISIPYQSYLGSNISLRIGEWDSSSGYNDTDLNLVCYQHFDNNSKLGENYGFRGRPINNSGSILYYYLNDSGTSIQDYSGNNNIGIANNTQLDFNGGILGLGSFTFNGVNSSINTSTNTLLPTGASNRTICVWAKISLSNTYQGIVGYGYGTTGNAFYIAKYSMHWYVWNINSADYDTGVTANTNWNYHCVVYNGTTLFYYLNGAIIGPNKTVALATTNNNLQIGRISLTNSPYNYYTNGSISDVIIFNRSLSSSEIKSRYDSYINDITFDSSGNGNNGITGVTWNSSGYIGGGYTLNGFNDTINFGNINSFSNGITVSLWVKTFKQFQYSTNYQAESYPSQTGINNATGEGFNTREGRMGVDTPNQTLMDIVIPNTDFGSQVLAVYGFQDDQGVTAGNFSIYDNITGQLLGSGNLGIANNNTADKRLNTPYIFLGKGHDFEFKVYFYNTTNLYLDYINFGRGGYDGLIGKSGSFSITEYGGQFRIHINGVQQFVAGSVNPNWQYISLTYNNTNVNLYTNGNLVGTSSYATPIFSNSNPVILGTSVYPYNFWGSVDETMIWNRSLTSDEINQLYLRGRTNWNYSDYQNLSGVNTFNISTNTTNILSEFDFINSPYNFYSPIIQTSNGLNISYDYIPPSNMIFYGGYNNIISNLTNQTNITINNISINNTIINQGKINEWNAFILNNIYLIYFIVFIIVTIIITFIGYYNYNKLKNKTKNKKQKHL